MTMNSDRDLTAAEVVALRVCNHSHPSDPEYPHTHNCVLPYFLLLENATPHAVAIYGHVIPAVVAVTIVTNGLTCLVLVQRSMRSATNVILVAMAIADTLTGVVPLPALVAFFTLGRCYDWVPYNWCLPYIFLTDHLPTVFHTASLWLTVTLALQRYVFVRCRAAAKRLCTVPNAVKAALVVYALAIVVQLPRLLELQFSPLSIQSLQPSHHSMVACYFDFVPSLRSNIDLYFNLYYWFRIVFGHLVPCALLVLLNFRLGSTIRRSHLRRAQLTRAVAAVSASATNCLHFGDGSAATVMLVVVVGLVLLVEVPLAGFLIVLVLENTLNVSLMSAWTSGTVAVFVNLFIVLGYPVNFVIYCVMSRQFRQTLFALISRTEVAQHPSTRRLNVT